MRYEKFGINCQLRNILILIVIFCFSHVKAAMNVARKLCNVVKKRFNFFFFQMPKVEQRPLRTCQLGGVEFLKLR
jgi:hypothetical protein